MEIINMDGKVLVEVPGDTLLNADLGRASLRNADLRYANLLGVDLRNADLRYADLGRATLQNATLRYVDLWRANLQNVDLRYADLQNADLREADLWRADLRIADLRYADLQNANLREANLCQAKLEGTLLPYYDETPVIPNIHKTVYQAASQPNALCMDLWHTCATTHCRGGWVITLAGEAGKALESKIGVNAAAALIYMKSDPELEQIPNWHASNEEALEDMRRLAS